MPKRIASLLTSTVITFVFLFAMFKLETPAKLWAYGESLYEKIQIFTTIVETLQRSYVEERTADELIEAAIGGMLEKLDPHTCYLPPDNFKNWNRSFEGFNGIGIYYDLIGHYPMITGFVEDGPASQTTLETGDIITEINGISTYGVTFNEIAQRIADENNSGVTLTVMPQGLPTPRVITLYPSHINLKSISGAYMLTDRLGYVEMDRFNGNTATEFDEAVDMLKQRGMKNLVLDLRDNGGGYLSAAVEVADRFLSKGKMIVYTRGRLPSSFQEYRATSYSTLDGIAVIVLLNHGTASAAEIVAGALQDWDRALIVGTTSFGKGLVQSQYRFRDSSAMLVTTAHYYTPLGRLIQRNYNNMSKDEYYEDAYNEKLRSPENNIQDKQAYKTPHKRTVYGGGGITPDVWASNDSIDISDELRRLYLSDQRFFYKYAMTILSRRPDLKNLRPGDANAILISNAELAGFEELVAKSNQPFSHQSFVRNKTDIAFLLKRDLAYLIAGNEGRFRVNFERDIQLRTACAKVGLANALLQEQNLVQTLGSQSNSQK